MLFLGFAASAAARCFYDLKDCSQRIIKNGRKSLFILQNYRQAFTSAWASLATTSLLRIHVMEQGTIAGQDLVGRDYGEQVMRIYIWLHIWSSTVDLINLAAYSRVRAVQGWNIVWCPGASSS
jgi:hypothetical protein